MEIRFGCEVTFAVQSPTATVCMVDLHPDTGLLCGPVRFTTNPPSVVTPARDHFGNLVRRFVAGAGTTTVTLDGSVTTERVPELRDYAAQVTPVQHLPSEIMTYLNPSRYCDSDRIAAFAWKTFGSTSRDTSLVEAICDHVHDHVVFGYRYARADRTASETLGEGIGVCRDFAHLAIAICRALNIPARYVNGYLGDIDVPPDPAPMDFNAWFEAYLGGRWYTFDARHNCRRVGRLVIGRGRDACDLPILQTFGPHVLTGFRVVTEEASTRGGDASAKEAGALAA